MQSEQSQKLTDLEQSREHSAGDLNRQNMGLSGRTLIPATEIRIKSLESDQEKSDLTQAWSPWFISSLHQGHQAHPGADSTVCTKGSMLRPNGSVSFTLLGYYC